MPDVVVLIHLRDCFQFLREQLFGRHEVEYSTRVVVDPHFDLADCLAREASDITPFGHEPTDHSVDVFIRAALPG